MPYDETLAARVRALIGARDAVTERKMFGGVAWMIHGNLACCVLREELMVRVDPEEKARALAEPHVRPFDMAGRPMRGFVVVGTDGLATQTALGAWVDAGADYAASLPPK